MKSREKAMLPALCRDVSPLEGLKKEVDDQFQQELQEGRRDDLRIFGKNSNQL